jgi:hypothetical protein
VGGGLNGRGCELRQTVPDFKGLVFKSFGGKNPKKVVRGQSVKRRTRRTRGAGRHGSEWKARATAVECLWAGLNGKSITKWGQRSLGRVSEGEEKDRHEAHDPLGQYFTAGKEGAPSSSTAGQNLKDKEKTDGAKRGQDKQSVLLPKCEQTFIPVRVTRKTARVRGAPLKRSCTG